MDEQEQSTSNRSKFPKHGYIDAVIGLPIQREFEIESRIEISVNSSVNGCLQFFGSTRATVTAQEDSSEGRLEEIIVAAEMREANRIQLGRLRCMVTTFRMSTIERTAFKLTHETVAAGLQHAAYVRS